jgi:hypothetical protein
MQRLVGRREVRRANSETHRGGRSGAPALVVLGLALSTGCGGDEATSLEPWSADAHFQVVGTIDGEDIDIRLDEASELADAVCHRTYEVPMVDSMPQYDQGWLVEIQLQGTVTIGDEMRIFQVELKRHDFQTDPVGAEVRVVPRIEGMDPPEDATWLEWEWHDLDDVTFFESAAQTGTATLELYTGMPDSTGLVYSEDFGAVGFTLSARWSASEHLDVSFTLPCVKSKVDFVDSI